MITRPGTSETGAQAGPAPSSATSSTAVTSGQGGASEGVQKSGGAQAPAATDAEESPVGRSGNAAGGTKDVRITGSDVPGTREAGLPGMSAAGQSDAAYQQAYRDCMQSRGILISVGATVDRARLSETLMAQTDMMQPLAQTACERRRVYTVVGVVFAVLVALSSDLLAAGRTQEADQDRIEGIVESVKTPQMVLV